LVSLVVPFYNEGEGVDGFFHALLPVLDQAAGAGARFEVVCVDDGSRDDTLARLLAVVQRDARVRIVELSRNFGKEAALTAGIEAAQGDAVVFLDADLQDPPDLIPTLIAAWRSGADVVLAHRSDRATDPFLKRWTAEGFYRLFNRLSPTPIPRDVGDFRLMNRASIDAVRRLHEHERFMKGLFAWVGFRTVTIDYRREPRTTGQSKFSGWGLWNFALTGITSFSTVPLRIWTYVGGLGAMVAVLYASFIVLRTLIFGVDVPGYASLLAVTLTLGSLQLISVGILGEYIGRIYMETKGRPQYIVRACHGLRGRQDGDGGGDPGPLSPGPLSPPGPGPDR
jgi:glycosyltransferase involved in cell wall biosynthesis